MRNGDNDSRRDFSERAAEPDPKYMLSRDGTRRGEIKNLRSRRCSLEGCNGVRIHVKWPDGKSTYPCSKGCKRVDDETMQIE